MLKNRRYGRKPIQRIEDATTETKLLKQLIKIENTSMAVQAQNMDNLATKLLDIQARQEVTNLLIQNIIFQLHNTEARLLGNHTQSINGTP